MKYKTSMEYEILGVNDIHEIDTDILKDIFIEKSFLTNFSDSSLTYSISYKLSYEDSISKIMLIGTCNDVLTSAPYQVQIEPIQFTNEIAEMIRDKEIIDNINSINAAKRKIIKHFSTMLLTKDIFCINSTYDCFAYIYSNAKKVGTFEIVDILSSKELAIREYQSIVDLENIDNIYIDLYINNKIHYAIEADSIKQGDIVCINNMTIVEDEIPREILSLKNRKEFNDEEEFFLSRRNLISESNENEEDIVELDLFDM